MEGIQQVVGLLGDHGRRYGEHGGPSFPQPACAEFGQSLGRRVVSPVPAELRYLNPGDRQRGRDLGGDRDEIARCPRRPQMDEDLDGGEGETRGRVDDRYPRPIPAASVGPSAFAVKGRVLGLADAPAADQL